MSCARTRCNVVRGRAPVDDEREHVGNIWLVRGTGFDARFHGRPAVQCPRQRFPHLRSPWLRDQNRKILAPTATLRHAEAADRDLAAAKLLEVHSAPADLEV